MSRLLVWIEVSILIAISLFLVVLINWPALLFEKYLVPNSDFQYHDTYFIVANFQFLYFLVAWFLALVWIYLKVLPIYKATYIQHGHFILTVVSVILIFFLLGPNPNVPKRYADYPLDSSYIDQLNLLGTIGGWLFFISQAALITILVFKYFRSK